MIYAFLRYHRIRFPEVRSYPGALLNATVTAFIDEVAFRGALFGLLLLTGLDPTLANIIQAILYTLTTRLGAPGRDRYLFVLTIGIGLVGGYLTAVDRWDRRGLPRACHHPVRGLPLHRPHRPAAAAGPGGRGDRGATPAAAGLADRRLAGSGAAGSVTAAAAMPPTTSATLPPVALYVHIPFCVSLCPYCDFVVYAGAAARGPRNRVAAFLAALETELELRAAGVPAFPAFPRRRSRSKPSTSAVAHRRCSLPRPLRGCSTGSGHGSGWPPGPR